MKNTGLTRVLVGAVVCLFALNGLLLLQDWHGSRRQFISSRAIDSILTKTSSNENCLEDKHICCKMRIYGFKGYSVVNARFMPSGKLQKMAVHHSRDAVSGDIIKYSSWDPDQTRKLIGYLRRLGKDAVLLDIGANIGWFSLAAAYAGYRVISIEPFGKNVNALRRSLCLAPTSVRNRVTLIHTGLSNQDGVTCGLWQNPKANIGNTNTICKKGPFLTMGPGYKLLEKVHLRKLDTLLKQGKLPIRKGDKVVVKIDVEGFEPFVFAGARAFLNQLRPKVIYSEFKPSHIEHKGKTMGMPSEKARKLAQVFLNDMDRQGYSYESSISKSTKGRYVDDYVYFKLREPGSNLRSSATKPLPGAQRKSCSVNDENCCRNIAKESLGKGDSVVHARFIPSRKLHKIAVHHSKDAVSHDILKYRTWDPDQTRMLMGYLRGLGKNAMLLDIGANIGWFSLAAAYAGYRVISVEPFRRNVNAFRHSLCIAPRSVRNRVTLLHTGLSNQDGITCGLWQNPIKNVGNTNTICKKGPFLSMGPGFKLLEKVHLRKLDTLLRQGKVPIRRGDKVVVKIDVEGFEPFVFKGAHTFLKEIRPKIIYSEFKPGHIEHKGKSMGMPAGKAKKLSERFLNEMVGFGYSMEKSVKSKKKGRYMDDYVYFKLIEE